MCEGVKVVKEGLGGPVRMEEEEEEGGGWSGWQTLKRTRKPSAFFL